MNKITKLGRSLRSRGVLPADAIAARAAIRAASGRIAVDAHDVCALAEATCRSLVESIKRGEAIDVADVLSVCERVDDVASVATALAVIACDPNVSDDMLSLAADVRSEIDGTMRALRALIESHYATLRAAARSGLASEQLASVAWPHEFAWWIRLFA